MPILVLAALATATVLPAPVSRVTVYSDRARVQRAATVSVSGVERVELPLLTDQIDPSTILVEAQGAEVRRVDIEHVDADDFPRDEARELLEKLEKADDELARVRGDRAAAQTLLAALGQLKPQSNSEDSLRPVPKLNPVGWSAVLAFVADFDAKLQERSRDLDEKLVDLERDRERLRERAQQIGGAARRSGWRVVPQLAGNGSARVLLTYFVTNARWYPSYDLQLAPDRGQVQIALAGQVSQETGEDWNDAQLVLSTAVPATSTVAPKLMTWKIGERERFIPTPQPAADAPRPPPRPMPLPVAEREEEFLRRRLLAYAPAAAGRGGGQTKTGGESSGETINGYEDRDGDGIADDQDGCPDDASGRPTSTANGEDGCPPADNDKSQGQVAQLDRLRQKVDDMKKEVRRSRTRMQLLSEQTIAAKAPGVVVAEPPPPPSPVYAESVLQSAPAVRHRWRDISTSDESEREPPPTEVGLLPPTGYRPPTYAPELPASLAGGYDLFFPSLRRETIKSGQGARRVALFAEEWPVSVERRLYPALAPEAFLVAEIKNPSGRVLPGGPANLFVGADPAGVAKLKVSAPGETFTLPLGIDRAVKPIRNVKLVLQEKGVVFKDEVNQYQVSTEVANPYPGPLHVRIYDQLPLSSEKSVEVRLLRNDQVARVVNDTGAMEWELTVPPRGKVAVTFVYSLRRPKGWQLHQ